MKNNQPRECWRYRFPGRDGGEAGYWSPGFPSADAARKGMNLEREDDEPYEIGHETHFDSCARFISADDLIELMAVRANDECGDSASDWLMDVSREEGNALENVVHAAIDEWLKNTERLPEFGEIEIVERSATI